MSAPEQLWQTWSHSADEAQRAASLTAIGAAGDAWDLPHLLRIVLNAEREPDAQAASAAMAAVVLRISPADLPKYDTQLRPRLPSLAPTSLLPRRHRLQYDQSWAALGLCSFHANGYVRELVVQWLAAAASVGQTLPFLLLRLNDWVPQVREAARQGIEARLSLSHANALVAALPLVIRLRQLGRAQHGELVGRVLAVLKDPACHEALTRGLTTPDARGRREVYRIAIQNQAVDTAGLLGRALDDDSEAVRLWASQQLRQHLDLAGWAQLAERASRDRFASVRRDALITSAPYASAIHALKRGLLDERAAVRVLAARYLRKQREGFEPAVLYRRVLASADAKNLRPALLGLGEVGTSDDADVVLPFVDHRVARVRAAAVRSFARLRPEQSLRVSLRALVDERPRVSNEAAGALARQPHLLAVIRADLESIARSLAVGPHGQRHAQRLLQLADEYSREWG